MPLNTPFRNMFVVLVGVIATAIIASCASIGNPSGGPRDEDPPRFRGANPPLGSTSVTRNRIVLDFDEIVNVKDAFSKVVISPTSAKAPRVSSLGHKVIVEFKDTLEPETTYTIDFGNAIEDNNEGNKLPSFSYWFSTGAEIDTLQIAGMVLGARDLEPQQGMLVGVHTLLEDSVFKTRRLERIAKTDDRGRFIIRGLKPGRYRLFALKDINGDYRWDNTDEDIAFTDFLVEPYAERVEVADTIYNMLTGAVDSVAKRVRTRFLPNDILLNSFNVNRRKQYLVSNERIDSTRISLIFNAPLAQTPRLSLVGQNAGIPDWHALERSADNDTLTYWITDPRLLAADTLRVSLEYLMPDSAGNLAARADTLRMLTNRPKAKKNDDKKKADEPRSLGMSLYNIGTKDISAPVIVEFAEPLQRLDTAAFRLEVKVDTLWKDAPAPLRMAPVDSLTLRRYRIDYPWDYGTTYRLSVDSLAATGIYGLSNKEQRSELTTKKLSDYFNVKFRITGLPDTIPAFVELLNNRDEPVRTATVKGGVAAFTDVPLGTYYARLVEDINGNGIYDTGDYDTGRQPEFVYYYPKTLKLTKRWDLEQPWDVIATPLDMQKPAAVKKNKPEADKRKHQEQKPAEEEDGEDALFPSASEQRRPLSPRL